MDDFFFKFFISWNNYGGIRKLPFAYTEETVYKLATIIRTQVAELVTSNIIKAFITMRNYIGENLLQQKYINDLVLKDHDRIDVLEKLC